MLNFIVIASGGVETLDRRVGVGLSEETTMSGGLNKDLEGRAF